MLLAKQPACGTYSIGYGMDSACSISWLPCCVQVAGRTNDAAGDGTTTATVLAREMIRFGLQVTFRQLALWGWHLFAAKLIMVFVARFQPALQCCCWAFYHLPIGCLQLVQNVTAGANPISIKRGIDKTCEYLVRQAAVFLQTSVLGVW